MDIFLEVLVILEELLLAVFQRFDVAAGCMVAGNGAAGLAEGPDAPCSPSW